MSFVTKTTEETAFKQPHSVILSVIMKTALFLAAVALCAGCSAASSNYTWDKTCGTQYDRLITKQLTMSSRDGKGWHAGTVATIRTDGDTDLHSPLVTGAWVANIYETGHAHKVANFAGHLTDAITFTDPKNTTFAGKFAFTMPAPTTSGQFTVSLMATDQAKAMYFCIQIHYAIAMDGGFDAVDHHHIPGAYCMNDPTKQPPYYCHIPGPINCNSDSQCSNYYGQGADMYCMNGPSKSAPYYCHAPSPHTCKTDSDC